MRDATKKHTLKYTYNSNELTIDVSIGTVNYPETPTIQDHLAELDEAISAIIKEYADRYNKNKSDTDKTPF